ncbi:MAG TPA: hypothetical protein VE046_10930 [Steroidobacteraceae bacterium]|nr:hypothetical protein [Steroidobacteraceae bacterium]
MEVLPKRCSSHVRERPERHRPPRPGASLAAVLVVTGLAAAEPAPDAAAAKSAATPDPVCLPSGNGYLKARLAGEINSDIDWVNAGTSCEGMPRPNGRGLRLSFARTVGPDGHRLVIVFGVARIGENQSGKALPVNVTVIVEGASLFYGTRGDDKCLVDRLRSQPLSKSGRARIYRVEARGFCTQPARAVRGDGAVLISTFDFAGQVSFDDSTAPPATRDETTS